MIALQDAAMRRGDAGGGNDGSPATVTATVAVTVKATVAVTVTVTVTEPRMGRASGCDTASRSRPVRLPDRTSLIEIATLGDRERDVVALRFHHRLSQAEIGQRLAMSQMHVSRLLSRALGQVRAQLDAAL